MDAVDKGQVTSNAAEVYEAFFVPALFQQWTEQVARAARIQPGQSVIDVACGTGALTRTVAKYAGTTGKVIGYDINEGMLSVARNKNPEMAWRLGNVESMPFDDGAFDAVVSQFALMFFEDRRAAIDEMVRILKPGGCLAVAVWGTLANTPGYAAMVRLLERVFGANAANGLRAPYNLGDVQEFKSLFQHPQLTNVTVNTASGSARFASIEKWVYTDIKGWVLSDAINDTQFAHLLKEAQTALAHFVTDDGSVVFAAPAHILTATKTN